VAGVGVSVGRLARFPFPVASQLHSMWVGLDDG
jgi:hypothetical protein